MFIEIDEDIRGKDVFIIQSTCPPNINDKLMELMLMISTCRRASAREVTSIVPYFGYARQNRRQSKRVAISAADVARLLEAMGVDRIVSVDLRCGQIQGFFGPFIPVDDLPGSCVGVDYFAKMDLVKPVIVSYNAGHVFRAKQFRDGLMSKHDIDAGVAMVIKQESVQHENSFLNLVGNVDGSDCVLVDDLIDTSETLCAAAKALKEHGARRVFAFASHGLFSKDANTLIRNSELEKVVVLNTVPLSKQSKENEKIEQLSIAALLADAVCAISEKQSVSALTKRR